MRRKDREVTDFEKITEIISECEIIRLGFSSGDFPYIVPMNFAYEVEDGQIYFYVHGATAGRKYELIQNSKLCSFEMDCGHMLEILPEQKDVTMRYKCLMGKAEIELLHNEEKTYGIGVLMSRHKETKNFEYNKSAVARTMVARLRVTEYSGKINPPNGNPD